MNRDKKLLEAFQSWMNKMALEEPMIFETDHEDIAMMFLASPEYKELEVTDEMIFDMIPFTGDNSNRQKDKIANMRKGAIIL
jgi:hypothetical protein